MNEDSANLSSVSKSTDSGDGTGLVNGGNVPCNGVGRRQSGVSLSSEECG